MNLPSAELTDRINRNGDVNDPATPRPLLTLEEFFEGNDDFGSICCNLAHNLTVAEIYEILKRIRSRSDVNDVRVQVTQHDDPSAWPFSDTVWVITNASKEDVASWIGEEIGPDEVDEGWMPGTAYEPLSIPPGMRPMYLWWD